MIETRTVESRGSYALCKELHELHQICLYGEEVDLVRFGLELWQLRLQARRQQSAYYTPWPVVHYAERSLQMLGNPPWGGKDD